MTNRHKAIRSLRASATTMTCERGCQSSRRGGATYNGGAIPVNVSGGLLSKGHPLGATGSANLCEVVTHLRGEAGARQVQDARIGLTHVVGIGSAA
jgi:acetyl-CoA acetyltransferase